MSTIKVDTITDEAGTGAPTFSQGAAVTGNLSATGTIAGGVFSGSGAGLTSVPSSAVTGLTPTFNPASVTGATPSLNLGSYNFFDNGTLTADTTVSFTNVPTNARWSYSAVIGASSGYSFSAVTKSPNEFVVNNAITGATAITSATDMYFKPDGLKVFIVCTASDSVHAFTLSTAWDITTASYDSVFYNTSSQEIAPLSLSFKPDGTMMFVGGNSDALYRYNLSTAWDVSTASHHSTRTTSAKGVYHVTFKPDGTQAWMTLNDNKVYLCTMTTAWDLSTMTITGTYNNFVSQGTPHNFLWNANGTVGFNVQENSFAAYSYAASTPYDITTLSTVLDSTVLKDGDGVTGANVQKNGIAFGNSGKYFYTVGSVDQTIYQYNTVVLSNITFPSSLVSSPTEALAFNKRATYDFYTTDGGTTVNLIGEEIR